MRGELPLGKPPEYSDHFDPEVLRSIERAPSRREIGITDVLPFGGCDLWNAYELSWLGPRGLPVVAMGVLRVPCESPRLVESKSLKLYLGSLNQTRFDSAAGVARVIARDVSECVGCAVEVTLDSSLHEPGHDAHDFRGVCVDDLEIEIDTYTLAPELLKRGTGSEVSESLTSHLLRTRCPVTGQPDWASVLVRYRGPAIDRAGLLRYLVSFRNHRDFHEVCVERIFSDVQRACDPIDLTVYARYTRRGGLDINPFRSNFESLGANERLARQ